MCTFCVCVWVYGSMRVCVQVYMFLCVEMYNVFMCICLCVGVSVCLCVHMCVYVCVYMLCVSLCVCVCVCVFDRVCMLSLSVYPFPALGMEGGQAAHC